MFLSPEQAPSSSPSSIQLPGQGTWCQGQHARNDRVTRYIEGTLHDAAKCLSLDYYVREKYIPILFMPLLIWVSSLFHGANHIWSRDGFSMKWVEHKLQKPSLVWDYSKAGGRNLALCSHGHFVVFPLKGSPELHRPHDLNSYLMLSNSMKLFRCTSSGKRTWNTERQVNTSELSPAWATL